MKIERKIVTTTTTHREEKVSINKYCCAGMRHLMGYIGIGHRYLSVPYSFTSMTSRTLVNSIKELKDFPMRFCPFCGEEIEVDDDREYVIIDEGE